MLKFEYRGLDLMDEIASVPVAYDEKLNILHIKDEFFVVWPDFDGKCGYKLSDGFFQMVRKLKTQHLFKAHVELSEEQWVASFTFYFYQSLSILLFKGDEFIEIIPFNSKKHDNLLVFLEWVQ